MDWTHGAESEAHFRVTLAAEDQAASRRAQALYHRLARRLSTHLEFTQHVWGFNDLECASLRQTAGQQAARSDMIVVAFRGDRPLPEAVQSWLDALPVLKRSSSVALVILMELPAEGAHLPPMREYLHSLAARCRMDLFIHSTQSAGPLAASAVTVSHAAHRTMVPQMAAETRPQTCWGINE